MCIRDRCASGKDDDFVDRHVVVADPPPEDKPPTISVLMKQREFEQVVALVYASKDVVNDIDPRDAEGRSALLWACEHRDLDAVLFLLAHGADLNQLDAHGESALHVALQHGCAETARVLLVMGASVDCKSLHGHTPVDKLKHGPQDCLYLGQCKTVMSSWLWLKGVLKQHGADGLLDSRQIPAGLNLEQVAEQFHTTHTMLGRMSSYHRKDSRPNPGSCFSGPLYPEVIARPADPPSMHQHTAGGCWRCGLDHPRHAARFCARCGSFRVPTEEMKKLLNVDEPIPIV
eukprot:TRINITY_DN28075_c0_g1_i1.p1 TRINITY_DN28075_c0_g1~~TRINITY_DN28075_c0_g1_i1.p1  ORF type:complete len:288 (-),score=53.00 TRINITY_DN28075_c0_g1_i1:35-898(-)